MEFRFVNDEWGIRVIYAMVSKYLHADGGKQALYSCKNYAAFEEGECIGWIGYHSFDNGACDVDVCIARERHGKWLTRGVGKWLLNSPRQFGCNRLYAKAHNPKWEKALLKIGFTRAYNEPSKLVFTYDTLQRKFLC